MCRASAVGLRRACLAPEECRLGQGGIPFFAVAYAIRSFLGLRITSSRPGTVVQLPGATTALYLEHLFR